MLRRRKEEDEQLVTQAMRELAQEPAADQRRLPDPSFIWWKAQLLRRFEAEREDGTGLQCKQSDPGRQHDPGERESGDDDAR